MNLISFPTSQARLYIRRCRGEHPLAYYSMNERWDPRTIKVWACISPFGVGPLVRYSGSMDHIKYIDILNTYLMQAYPKLRGTNTRPGTLLFQQDNAGAHRDHHTKAWLKDNRVYTLEWPSFSPDLNPIENLWGILQDKLYDINDTFGLK